MRDWSQFNRMMDTVLYYMMQKRLGDQRAKDSMAYLKESQEGNELLAKMKHNLELEAEGEKNELEKDMVFLEAVMRANEDTTVQYYKKLGQLYADKDPKLAATYMGKYEEGLDKLITGVIEEQKGKTTREGKAGLFGQAGLETGLDISKEARGVHEYDTTLPITRQQADTSAAQAGTSRGRLLLDIEKEGKEETGELSQKEYADDIAEMVDDELAWMEGRDVGGESLTGEAEPGAITEKDKARISTKLQKLKVKAKTERLTDDEENFLTSIRDMGKASEMSLASPIGGEMGGEVPGDRAMKLAQMLMDEAQKQGKQLAWEEAKRMANQLLIKR